MRTSKLGRLMIRGAVVAAAGFATLSVAGPAAASDDGSSTETEIVAVASVDAEKAEKKADTGKKADGGGEASTLGLEWG